MSSVIQRRGIFPVRKEQRPDRERARAVRARQRAIGRELRRIYDDVAQEPVPNDFLDLLQKIDAKPKDRGT